MDVMAVIFCRLIVYSAISAKGKVNQVNIHLLVEAPSSYAEIPVKVIEIVESAKVSANANLNHPSNSA